MIGVDVLIVTYNRSEKLKRCLTNILKFDVNKIFVVNNNSSDNTKEIITEFLKKNEKIVAINLEKNIGGAGGFNVGFKQFVKNGNSQYLWVMDDDAFPLNGSLKKLILALNSIPLDKRGFAVGKVLWTDGTLAKMNIPSYKGVSFNSNTNNKYPLLNSASFVSILFSREAIVKTGYPISDFFVWGDDVEYTSRIIKNGFIGIEEPQAKIRHEMKENKNTSILSENDNVNRLNRCFFDLRNSIYNARSSGHIKFFMKIIRNLLLIFEILLFPGKFKLLKIKIVLNGTLKGIFFTPDIENVSANVLKNKEPK